VVAVAGPRNQFLPNKINLLGDSQIPENVRGA
jgi:hypothetical protein